MRACDLGGLVGDRSGDGGVAGVDDGGAGEIRNKRREAVRTSCMVEMNILKIKMLLRNAAIKPTGSRMRSCTFRNHRGLPSRTLKIDGKSKTRWISSATIKRTAMQSLAVLPECSIASARVMVLMTRMGVRQSSMAVTVAIAFDMSKTTSVMKMPNEAHARHRNGSNAKRTSMARLTVTTTREVRMAEKRYGSASEKRTTAASATCYFSSYV